MNLAKQQQQQHKVSAKVTKTHPQEQKKGSLIFNEEDSALQCCKEWGEEWE